ncbi:MAG: UbiA family prenyltransferase [archaeon]|jgi:hypothetical protein
MAKNRKSSFKNLRNYVNSIENSKVPFAYLLVLFFISITLRNFLEVLFSGAKLDSWTFLHFYLYYALLFLVLGLFFYFVTKVEMKKIARAILPFFSLIIFVPIADVILSGGRGFKISYLLPGIHNDILIRFFTFGGGFVPTGMTPGIKLVGLIALLFSFFYFYSKKIGAVKSFFYTFLIYVFGFCFLVAPFFLKFFSDFFGINLLDNWDITFASFYAILIFVAGAFVFYFSDKRKFLWLFGGKGFLRLFHYELMFFAGVFIGLKSGLFSLSGQNFFYFLLVPIAIFFAGIFSGMVNDIEDFKKGAGKDYGIAFAFLAAAIFYSLLAGFFATALIFIGSVIFFIYSARPLRLKRIPVFSKFLLACGSLVLVLLGYLLVGGQIALFPPSITIFFLVGVSLAINFIDLKDYESDKKDGIMTLPVLLGMKRAKILIGIFFIGAYALAYFIFNNPLLIFPLSFFALAEFYLITRKNYSEKAVFAVYIVSIILLLPFF